MRLHARPVAPWAAEPEHLAWQVTLPGRLPDLDLRWGSWLVAETPLARWTVQELKHEVVAAVEPRELGGRSRHELGSFRTVAAAMAACERDLARRLALRVALSLADQGLVDAVEPHARLGSTARRG